MVLTWAHTCCDEETKKIYKNLGSHTRTSVVAGWRNACCVGWEKKVFFSLFSFFFSLSRVYFILRAPRGVRQGGRWGGLCQLYRTPVLLLLLLLSALAPSLRSLLRLYGSWVLGRDTTFFQGAQGAPLWGPSPPQRETHRRNMAAAKWSSPAVYIQPAGTARKRDKKKKKKKEKKKGCQWEHFKWWFEYECQPFHRTLGKTSGLVSSLSPQLPRLQLKSPNELLSFSSLRLLLFVSFSPHQLRNSIADCSLCAAARTWLSFLPCFNCDGLKGLGKLLAHYEQLGALNGVSCLRRYSSIHQTRAQGRWF